MTRVNDQYRIAKRLAENGEYNKARPYLENAAEQGCGAAYYALANWYIQSVACESNPKKAFEFLKKAVNAGFKDAFYDLAAFFLDT